jgi:hypothetical protein
MVFSVEPRLSILKPDGVILGLPVEYEYPPESEVAGVRLGDERRLLSAGCSYTLAARSTAWPFEVTVRYQVPMDGKNRIREQRLSLSGKVEIPLIRVKGGECQERVRRSRCFPIREETITAVRMTPPPRRAGMPGFSPVTARTQRGFNTGSTTAVSMACMALTRRMP